MILVDTSVWIDHLRRGTPDMAERLQNAEVACHPFVIGELGCGHLKNRRRILDLLTELPQAIVADEQEVMHLVESKKLMGQGIGWIDCHLLASALLSGFPVWTLDRKLRAICAALEILY